MEAETKQHRTFNILKWLLIVSIVIVLNLFFNFAITSFYHAPKFEDFCKTQQVNVQPTSSQACLAVGGQWNETSATEKPIPAQPDNLRPQTTGYCDIFFTCQKNYQSANDLYQRNLFVVLIVLGILSLIAGFLLSASSVVSLGLSFGGVLSLIIASIRYWSSMDEFIRVIILGIALVILIWIGIKKFKE